MKSGVFSSVKNIIFIMFLPLVIQPHLVMLCAQWDLHATVVLHYLSMGNCITSNNNNNNNSCIYKAPKSDMSL